VVACCSLVQTIRPETTAAASGFSGAKMNTDRLETIAASDDVERDIDATFRAKLFGVRILQRAVSISLAITQRISLKMIPGRGRAFRSWSQWNGCYGADSGPS
jgi:hypothetical protein